MFALREILERADHRRCREDYEWPDPKSDASTLALFFQSAAGQVLHLNRDRPQPEDLCPLCAGYTWGRPSLPGIDVNHHDGDVRDYTRRMCSECGEIRPEAGPDPEYSRFGASLHLVHDLASMPCECDRVGRSPADQKCAPCRAGAFLGKST